MQGELTSPSNPNGELPDSLIYPKYLPLWEVVRGGIESPQRMNDNYSL